MTIEVVEAMATITTTVDILVVGHAYGLAGPVSIERAKTAGDPSSFLLKHAGFALDYLAAIHQLTQKNVNFTHSNPKPLVSEAYNKLLPMMPAGWTLENADQLGEIHRVRPTGWYPAGSGFAFGFRIQQVTSPTTKLALRRTPLVSGQSLVVDFLLVLQSQ